MSELNAGPPDSPPVRSRRHCISRTAAVVLAPALVAGAFAVAAPSAQATTPSSGVVTAWGADGTGEADVPAAAQSGVTSVAAGYRFALALKSDGSVIAWGDNQVGDTSVPAAAQSGVVAIAATNSESEALKSDGTIINWGAHPSTQPAIAGVTQIAALDDGGLALKSDHTIVAWGLGDSDSVVPAAVQGRAVSIVGGHGYGAALTDTGAVVAWGTDYNTLAPITVPAAATSGVVKIVGTAYGQLAAIKSDGSVLIWAGAPLGPIPAAAQSGVVNVAVGEGFAVAVKSDGTIVTWGPDTSLGEQDVPASVGYQTTSLAAGYNFGVAVHQPTSAPAISGTPAVGQPGLPYTFTPTVTGTPSPTVTVSAGSLPPGLKLDSSGQITGTPTSLGTDNFTLTADNGMGSPATLATTIVVGQAPAISGTPAAGYTGLPYTFTPTVTGSPNPTVTVSAGSLPPGLKIDSSGQVTGTPTSPGRYNLTLSAANGVGSPATLATSITIAAAQAPSLAGNPGDGVIGTPYSFTPTLTGTPTPTVTKTGGSPPPGLQLDSAGRIAGTPTAAGTYAVNYTASNGVNPNSSGTLTITIHLSATPVVTEQPMDTTVPAGQPMSFHAAADGDPTPTVQWQKAPSGSDQWSDIPGATSTTYAISSPATADSGSRYRAVFTNDVGSVTTDPAALTVAAQIPQVIAPHAAVGQPYLFTLPVTGVLNPVVTLSSGTPPPGLTVNPDGTITGTPTTVGTTTFLVTTNGSPTEMNVTLSVGPASTITGTAPNGETDYQYQWVPTVTGNPTLSITSGALPDGVRLYDNELLTGVPTKPGVFTFTITADNGYGTPASLTETVTVKSAPSIVGTPPAGTVGTAYAYQFATTGYPAPTVTIKSGKLPDGLSIDAAGKITGTPTTSGQFGFTVNASSGTTQDASTYATILINTPSPVPTISGAPPNALLNTAYRYAFTLGGSPTPTLSITSGALPAGLSLTGGVLTGTPTEAGTGTFTLTATNQYGTASLAVWMTVGTVPVIGADAPNGTVGTGYSFSYPVTASPAAFLTVSAGLPAGLSLSAGTLSGTPLAAGAYTFTVTATNEFGSVSRTEHVTIDPGTAGQAKMINPPASVQPGGSESNTTIGVFGEQLNQTLTSNLTIGGTTIPAGTKVNSYYVNADAVGDDNTDHPFAGSLSFGTQVLAIATSTADLQATDSLFGLGSTTYSTSPDAGLEYNDSVSRTSQTDVAMSFNVYNTADAIRIITLAPPPAQRLILS